MNIINFFANITVPFIIISIIIIALLEEKKVFDLFIDGAKDGMKIVLSIFPTLIGLFLAIGFLRSSGVINIIINILTPLFNSIKLPTEILPLALIRPISGSGSIAVATDILKQYGVDSDIGVIASVIMGSTETTIYTIAVYTSCVNIKKTRFVLWSALIADVVGMLASVAICRFLS